MHIRAETVSLSAVLALALLISACNDTASGDIAAATTALCEDLDALRTSVESISAQASVAAPGSVDVGDVRTARNSAAQAFDDVRSSTSQFQAALVAPLQAAFDDLNSAVENLDDDTTLQEAQTEFAARKTEFLTAWQQVAGLLECPIS